MMAKPPTSSFVSAKGPSITVNLPSSSRTRAPAELGRHPSVAISQPSFIASPISFPISAISCCVGGRSGLPGLYKHKNRMVVFLSSIYFEPGCFPVLLIDRIRVGRIDTFSIYFGENLSQHFHQNPDSHGGDSRFICDMVSTR